MVHQKNSDFKFIFVSAVLVGLLGLQVASDLTSEDDPTLVPSVAAKKHPDALNAKNSLAKSREPASYSPNTAKADSILDQVAHFDLNCSLKQKTQISIASGFVQLHGKNCVKDLDIQKIEITNQTNGYTASVFFGASEKYQTDLIQLSKGENNILIRFQERSGKKSEEIIKVFSNRL